MFPQETGGVMRKWRLVADEFGAEPIVFEARTATEAADELAGIWEELYGWRPNLVMLGDSVAIRWHHRLDCLDCTSKVLDGEEEFDRGYWLRHPNWMTVLVPEEV